VIVGKALHRRIVLHVLSRNSTRPMNVRGDSLVPPKDPIHGVKSITCTTVKTLLVVGPQPPPVGGGTVTVQAFLDELPRHTFVQVAVVNTSPPDYRKKTVLFGMETLRRAILITRQYVRKIRNSDAVLVFASNLFIFILGYLLLLLARPYHIPFYLKPLGGDLGLYLRVQKRPIRSYMLMVLRAASGVLVQTRQVQAALAQLGCTNTFYVPGYRPLPQAISSPTKDSEELRLIFLSQIVREKGPLVVLEALRAVALEGNAKVTCDFYGPILEEDRKEFIRQLEATPGARYCGTAEVGAASRLIAMYDALVFPTYFIGEGHPGVIIEAMQAGVPVISTQHQAIPELISDSENGFLVPVHDSHALAEAMKRIALDRPLRKRMGAANYLRGQGFRADVVVPQMLEIIFPE
jgi:glycosyltransferase involved in cell wall biosynthesis